MGSSPARGGARSSSRTATKRATVTRISPMEMSSPPRTKLVFSMWSLKAVTIAGVWLLEKEPHRGRPPQSGSRSSSAMLTTVTTCS